VRFLSTRGRAPAVSFSTALAQGLAPDGGLYVPERFPAIDPALVGAASSFAEAAAVVLAPFLEGDPLEPRLRAMCERAFDFPVPLVPLAEKTAVLELFHGPTAAFKDFGARFLAECVEAQSEGVADERPVTILVATSGDTGGAVAAAFAGRPGTRVIVLYPQGGVSPRQEHQLTCWGGNVRAFSVRGTFDDCQRMAKAAFADPAIQGAARLTSANSINIGRLLPQVTYYAAASVWRAARTGTPPGFVVPTGNVGNAVSAFWAKRIGLPLARIALATNVNRPVVDWFETAEWFPRPSRPTVANAMDVGDPSNMERLFHLYPDRAALLADATAGAVDDATIRRTIAEGPARYGRIWCPHTATAVHVREGLGSGDWVVVATAHPAKFETIVEPLIGRQVELPPRLTELLARSTAVTEIAADLAELRSYL
jgi:threonine synthase